METSVVEPIRNTSSIPHSVRERIIAVHDAYLHVSPIREDAVRLFRDIAPMMRSDRGKAWVERMNANIETSAKNVEVAAASADVVIGVVGAGLSINLLRAIKNNRSASSDMAKVNHRNRSAAVTGRVTHTDYFVGRGTAGILILGGSILRPVTRITDFAFRHGKPVAGYVARMVDAILLRQEQKRDAKQIFVGQGKA